MKEEDQIEKYKRMVENRPKLLEILKTGIPTDPGRIFPGKSSKTIAAFLAKGFNNYLNKLELDQVDITLYRFKHSWAGEASFEETDYGWKFKRQIREYLKQYGFQVDIHKKGGYVTIKRRDPKKL